MRSFSFVIGARPIVTHPLWNRKKQKPKTRSCLSPAGAIAAAELDAESNACCSQKLKVIARKQRHLTPLRSMIHLVQSCQLSSVRLGALHSKVRLNHLEREIGLMGEGPDLPFHSLFGKNRAAPHCKSGPSSKNKPPLLCQPMLLAKLLEVRLCSKLRLTSVIAREQRLSAATEPNVILGSVRLKPSPAC